MPWMYVELPSPDGGIPFMLMQREALSLGGVGFSTTTDIMQKILHPPYKRPVAARLSLELQRLVYHRDVVSRGPQVVSVDNSSATQLVVRFSNASLLLSAGAHFGDAAACAAHAWSKFVASPFYSSHAVSMSFVGSFEFSVTGDTVRIDRSAHPGAPVEFNGPKSNCFLFGPSGLPGTPLILS
jgi:hypothetical protein